MYSGTTLSAASGRVLGVHQKIDRLARKHLSRLLVDDGVFPSSRRILHFEGKNGPDGIKRKSPAKDEPWHYFSPFDESDGALSGLIKDHYDKLVAVLKEHNDERTAFEAAWLAHAIVDGLTPAHHFPYEKKLEELRGGKGKESRTTIKQKLVLPGETALQMIKNNWKMWGPKGLFTTHGLFEMGIATLVLPLKFPDAFPKGYDVEKALENGVMDVFHRTAREIAVLDLYERYYQKGWTAKLSLDVRNKLIPTIIQTVTLFWYAALVESGSVGRYE